MSENPYDSPQAEEDSSEVTLSPEEAVAVRTPLLTHEVIVRTIAVLFFIKMAGTLSQIPFFLNVIDESGSKIPFRESTLYSVIGQWIALAVVCGFAGWALWKFRRWGWILSLILLIAGVLTSTSSLGRAALYAACIVPLLLPKTLNLFSKNYRRALSHSPRMKYGAKRVASVIAVLLLLMAVCGLIKEFVG